jgi:hypothetical protein
VRGAAPYNMHINMHRKIPRLQYQVTKVPGFNFHSYSSYILKRRSIYVCECIHVKERPVHPSTSNKNLLSVAESDTWIMGSSS